MNNWDFTELQSLGQVLIIGLGQTGVAAAQWCLSNGLSVRIADTREQPPGMAQLETYKNSKLLSFNLGVQSFDPGLLKNIDTLIISPGVSLNDKHISPLVRSAQEKNINIIGEIELFALTLNILRKQSYAPKILAVTGTNGKTTVTDMAEQIISDNGYKVMAAGNISPCAIQALQNAIENNELPQVWLLELSSFQLVTTRSLKIDCSSILNISQDHLDWHGGFTEYAKAKLRLLQMSKHWIINRDDDLLKQYIEDYICQENDIKHGLLDIQTQPTNSFGSNAPVYAGDIGIEILNGMSWFTYIDNKDIQNTVDNTQAKNTQNLMPVNAMLLRGMHNAMNAQCAMLLANSLGIQPQNCLPTVRAYLGQNHRMEYVNSIDGVDFINDSKGTNVGASVAALNGSESPVILIAGGLAKGQNFDQFAIAIKEKAKYVVLIGQDAQQIADLIKEDIGFEYSQTLEDAVSKAFNMAKSGDTVLLSPACASMDMFDSYMQRGDSFKQAVMQIALQKGQVV